MSLALRGVACACVLASASVLAACGGGSGGSTTPTIPCTLPAGTAVTLIYPIANATAVPDSLSSVILAVQPPLPAGWQIVLGSSTVAYYGQNFQTGTPVPLPSPVAPTPPNAILQYSTFVGTGGLGANTVFAVGLNNTNANCNSFPTFGSFTTQ